MFVEGHSPTDANYTPQLLMAPMIGIDHGRHLRSPSDYEVFGLCMVEAQEQGYVHH